MRVRILHVTDAAIEQHQYYGEVEENDDDDVGGLLVARAILSLRLYCAHRPAGATRYDVMRTMRAGRKNVCKFNLFNIMAREERRRAEMETQDEIARREWLTATV